MGRVVIGIEAPPIGGKRESLYTGNANLPGDFPFERRTFDLILSSVLAPYLNDEQTAALVNDLASRLAPGGVLAFVEQDLLRRVYARDSRDLDATMSLGLRPLLREAGLEPLPRRSFLWTDEEYLTYTRGLLSGLADAALRDGRITPDERGEWGGDAGAPGHERGLLLRARLPPRRRAQESLGRSCPRHSCFRRGLIGNPEIMMRRMRERESEAT